jgi:hypothetical protein
MNIAAAQHDPVGMQQGIKELDFVAALGVPN